MNPINLFDESISAKFAPHKFVVIDGHIYVPKDSVAKPKPRAVRKRKYDNDLFALKPGLNEFATAAQADALFNFWNVHRDDPSVCPAGMKLATFKKRYVVVL